MNILIHSQDNVVKLIIENLALFSSFKHIYLFGSILKSDVLYNDIDLLLIYVDFSEKIIEELDVISHFLEFRLKKTVDYTILSEQEEKDTNFIAKLNNKYLQIK